MAGSPRRPPAETLHPNGDPSNSKPAHRAENGTIVSKSLQLPTRTPRWTLAVSAALALLTGCTQAPTAAPGTPAAQAAPAAAKPADALPSWNDGATKQAILDFVAKTTTAG